MLAAIAAAAIGISEAFSTVHPKAGSDAGFRTIELNLWNPNGPTEDTRPALTYARHAWWLIGLGHLGQAYAWVVIWLNYETLGHRDRPPGHRPHHAREPQHRRPHAEELHRRP